MPHPPHPKTPIAARVHRAPIEWDYEAYPGSAEVPGRSTAMVRELINDPPPFRPWLNDSREGHRRLFQGTTPLEQPHFAGHYRGDSIAHYIQNYEVSVVADPRVGIPCALVQTYMDDFSIRATDWMQRYDVVEFQKRGTPEEAAILEILIELAANLLSRFVTIHPYANGNGHIGRMIVWIVFVIRGYVPKSWPLDGHPPCDDCLRQYLNGQTQPLRDFILNALLIPAPGGLANAHV